mmetsp:Transcript_9013/g.12004  ORF Transcript_9013/g.12004 Transcript_9013/m.12004 type:complete len:244 (-) Transcript_9013:181-912(-)
MPSAKSSLIVQSLFDEQSSWSLSSTLEVSLPKEASSPPVTPTSSLKCCSPPPSASTPSTPAPSTILKKKVRINLFENVSHEDKEPLYSDVIHDLWYSESDYEVFKRSNGNTAREILRVDSQFAQDRNSYKNTLMRVYETCCMAEAEDEENHQLNKSDAFFFQKWISAMPFGSEHVAVRTISIDKSMRRNDLVDTVMQIEEDEGLTEEQQVHHISIACNEISRPCRLLALHLGRAHADALNNEI